MIVLTVRQAAERLMVSAATVYGLCQDRALPHFRVGRRRGSIRIKEVDLDAFILAAAVPAASSPSVGPSPLQAAGIARTARE